MDNGEVKELKDTIKDLEKRINKLEISKEKTEFQYDEIMKAISRIENVTIPKLMGQVDELQSKPAKRYDNIINTFLVGVVSAVAAFVAAKFLG